MRWSVFVLASIGMVVLGFASMPNQVECAFIDKLRSWGLWPQTRYIQTRWKAINNHATDLGADAATKQILDLLKSYSWPEDNKVKWNKVIHEAFGSNRDRELAAALTIASEAAATHALQMRDELGDENNQKKKKKKISVEEQEYRTRQVRVLIDRTNAIVSWLRALIRFHTAIAGFEKQNVNVIGPLYLCLDRVSAVNKKLRFGNAVEMDNLLVLFFALLASFLFALVLLAVLYKCVDRKTKPKKNDKKETESRDNNNAAATDSDST